MGSECDAYNDIPLFDWDENQATGYVIQHHGFTLKNQNPMAKSASVKSDLKKTIFTLHETSLMAGLKNFMGSFLHVCYGMSALKKLLDGYRQKYHLAYFDEDGYRIFQWQSFCGLGSKEKRLYLHFFCLGKTSYEYDEWDIKTAALKLIAQKVKFI